MKYFWKQQASASLCLVALIVTACSKEKARFTISGEITNAANKTLYLEHIGTTKIELTDSVELTDGNFQFWQRYDYPDFYRLRIDNQIVTLAIDSADRIQIKADAKTFATNYTLEGTVDESLKIKALIKLQTQTAQRYQALKNQYETGNMSLDTYIDSLNAIIDDYKKPATAFMIADFGSLAAYFALFQQVNHTLIFDIYNKADNKLLGAIANAWDQNYPESPRTIQLKKMYLASRAVIRGERTVKMEETNSKAFLDIVLPDLYDRPVRLSEIGDGKVVIVDFTAYTQTKSPAHNSELMQIYEQYCDQGLEIYQVSLDADTHEWKNAAVNIPWICVHDEQSVYSEIAQRYNVRSLPATFIMDRDGNIAQRLEQNEKLAAVVKKYLR